MRFFLLKALEPGERWITVHPHGPDEKGTPVLIKPAGDGSFHVVGGAGGKLNYLRLTNVRDKASYAAEAKQRAQSKKEEARRQASKDKAAGLTDAKASIVEGLKATAGDARVKFVERVAKVLGWKDEDVRFPTEKFANVSETTRKAAEARHARIVLQHAQAAVDYNRKILVTDAETRIQSGLGEVPLTTSEPDKLSVQDLDPIAPAGGGLGFATNYEQRAGITRKEAAAEAETLKPPEKAEQRKEAADKRTEVAAKIAGELEGIRDPLPKLDPAVKVKAREAVELMKAAKEFSGVLSQVRKKVKTVKGASEIEPAGAYLIETGGPVDLDVVKDLDKDLRTLRARSFLDQVGKIAGTRESLGRYIGSGAYNAVNSLALAAGGASLLDRSVVDVLGVGGSAEVLARRLKADLTGAELQNVADAMSAFHQDRYMELSQESLKEARDLHEMAHEVELGEAANGSDLAVAQELNAKRRGYIADAQRILGTALGEMEANAALADALKQPAAKDVSVSLGKLATADAILRLRAIGLDKGDYTISGAGASTIATIHESGLDKLAEPVNKADMELVRESLAIINGERDEDNWLPQGVSDRPDLGMNRKPGVAPRLAKPIDFHAPDIGQAVRDYIGGRTADGDSPVDIINALQAEDVIQNAPDREAFIGAINEIAPPSAEKRIEDYADDFNKMADEFVSKTYGVDRMPLQRQTFQIDDTSIDALHRALAAHPDGVAAFKPIGELTPQDESALRKVFARQYGRSDPAAAKLQQAVDALDKQEPAKETEGLFGVGPNPDWAAWKGERDAAAEKANAASMDWAKYVTAMGSPQNAYAAMQDVVRSDVLKSFHEAHNTLKPDAPLRLGRQIIRNDIAHVGALDPKERERRERTGRARMASLMNRDMSSGKFQTGSVRDKMEAADKAERAIAQTQMGMFGAETVEPDEVEEHPLRSGDRYTIGHAAEGQIAKMMSVVGPNFRPGQPVKMFKPTMSGKFVARQRGVKLIEHAKRLELGMGVGSGKTSIMLSSFTDLKAKGKAKKGLYLVPSVVQGQFGGEALAMLKPGQYKWHAEPGASRESRLAAYKDPGTDFTVVTHQGFREDFDHVMQTNHSMTPAEFDKMSPPDRAAFAKKMMAAEGWNTDFLAVDEGHNLLNRKGKRNSHLANVADALSSNTEYYVSATADPVKNDASEAFDVLAKMEPDRYKDRDAFLRKYGVDTEAAKEGLRREMVRHMYTGSIDPGVTAHRQTIPVDINPAAGQHDNLTKLDEAASRARLARMSGKVDVGAMKVLSPYAFSGVPEAQHEEVAKRLQDAVGMIHATAVQHAINDGAKTEKLAEIAAARKGKPGVVFAHRLDRVKQIAARLEKDGHRVVTLTGADSSKEKDTKKRAYQAGEYDILVASDAGAVGANLQHGQWLAQYDTPQTAMLHAQRNGRIHRIGQKNNVELLDLVANHPSERTARDRLQRKYGLRDIMTSPLEGLDETGLAGYLNQARAGTLDTERPGLVPIPDDEPRQEPQAKGQMELAA
jgi:hypothetical protein